MVTLFVANLDYYKVGEDDLRSLFEEYGEVLRVKLPLDWEGKSRGFGFVDMAREVDALRALSELDGTEFRGRRLAVKLKQAGT